MQFRRALGLLPLALLFVAWHLAVDFKVYPTILLPPPAKVVMVFIEDWDTVLGNAAASVARVITGITLSFLFAVPLGLMIGRYQLLDTMTDWSIQIFRSIPPISLIPLALLFLGIGDKPADRADLPRRHLAAADQHHLRRPRHRTHPDQGGASGAGRRVPGDGRHHPAGRRYRRSSPACGSPSAAAGCTVVTAEMIAVKSGLGYMILNAQLTFRSDLIIAGIIVIGGIGLLADQLVRAVRAYVCRWQEGLTASPE